MLRIRHAVTGVSESSSSIEEVAGGGDVCGLTGLPIAGASASRLQQLRKVVTR